MEALTDEPELPDPGATEGAQRTMPPYEEYERAGAFAREAHGRHSQDDDESPRWGV